MRFIDLFSGLGGFHLGLSRLGHQCVFACEIADDLRSLYKKNFGIEPAGDIRGIRADEVPAHEVLCAGFPCQPFSKAGNQRGLKCRKWGDLFNHVVRIVGRRRPRYVILENVPNLARHNNGDTWEKMRKRLEKLGYDVSIKTLSPHRFGIPQIRERVFIVASLPGLHHFSWPAQRTRMARNIRSLLDKNPKKARKIPGHIVRCLRIWQKFLKQFPKKEELPSFPIWSMEFGATYPYKKTTPHAVGEAKLGQYRGNHGKRLSQIPASSRMNALPSYARVKSRRFPEWKIRFIEQNRALYRRHKKWIDQWKKQLLAFPQSRQKLEWNCKGEERNIWSHLIQIRASGVRVKRPTRAPAIVAMTSTQVPIVAWERRYMTARECAKLQSLIGLRHLPKATTRAYEALGNAVNADLVEMIAKQLLPKPRTNRTTKALVPTARSIAAGA